MANIVKYANQVWGEPITGERLSTNGYYTGHHKGTVLQDGKVEGIQQPYGVEEGIVCLGTMTQDAIEGSMPEMVTETADE